MAYQFGPGKGAQRMEELQRQASNQARTLFEKRESIAQRVFSMQKAVENDILVKKMKGLSRFSGEMYSTAEAAVFQARRGMKSFSDALGNTKGGQLARRGIRGAKDLARKIPRPLIRAGKAGGLLTVIAAATAGMTAVGIMRGAFSTAKDITAERYMQDQRMARNILMDSRVGLAIGTRRLGKYGSHNGLSNSLHRTRHGRGM